MQNKGRKTFVAAASDYITNRGPEREMRSYYEEAALGGKDDEGFGGQVSLAIDP